MTRRATGRSRIHVPLGVRNDEPALTALTIAPTEITPQSTWPHKTHKTLDGQRIH
jgi:hypothetical protein